MTNLVDSSLNEITKSIESESLQVLKSSISYSSPEKIVLIIEDDKSVIKILQILLEDIKIKNIFISTERSALAFLEWGYDKVGAAVCDMNLGKDENINNILAELVKCNIPVIIFTAYDRPIFEQTIAPEYKGHVLYRQKGHTNVKEMCDHIERMVNCNISIDKGELK